MTTKLQAKSIKAEIRTLAADNKTDQRRLALEIKVLDREIAKLTRMRNTMTTQAEARLIKREKRIAILQGRL